MAKFNTIVRESTKTTNLAGSTAYKFSAEVELIHAVLTTFLDDKYYESGTERISRLRSLMDSVLSSKGGPLFVARLALVARREFHLRSVSHLLLGELALRHNGDDIVKRAIVACAERPDDLTELAAYILTHSREAKLTKQAKRGIRNALLKFDKYQLAKYKGEGKAVSLVDLFNLVHPKVEHATFDQKEAWADLMAGELKSEDTWEAEISASQGDEEAKKASWSGLIMEGKMGYMALLRNLNNLIKSDVDEAVVAEAVRQLTDPSRVKKSKQLPFRFLTAYEHVKGNRLFTDAISQAMDIACGNMPLLSGKTLIAVDTSGSMSSGAIQKAAPLAAAMIKSNPNADVVLYDTSIKDCSYSSRLPVVDLAQRIIEDAMGGWTNTSLVFTTSKVYDRIIILSDNESWADTNRWNYYASSGGGTQVSLNEYRARTGADPYVYAIDIEGYGTKDVTGGRVFHLAGFSDRILDFIGIVERGVSLVEYINHYEL